MLNVNANVNIYKFLIYFYFFLFFGVVVFFLSLECTDIFQNGIPQSIHRVFCHIRYFHIWLVFMNFRVVLLVVWYQTNTENKLMLSSRSHLSLVKYSPSSSDGLFRSLTDEPVWRLSSGWRSAEVRGGHLPLWQVLIIVWPLWQTEAVFADASFVSFVW